MRAVIYIVPSIFSYGSKVEAHYRSTLFADLNLDITNISISSLVIKSIKYIMFVKNTNLGADPNLGEITVFGNIIGGCSDMVWRLWISNIG